MCHKKITRASQDWTLYICKPKSGAHERQLKAEVEAVPILSWVLRSPTFPPVVSWDLGKRDFCSGLCTLSHSSFILSPGSSLLHQELCCLESTFPSPLYYFSDAQNSQVSLPARQSPKCPQPKAGSALLYQKLEDSGREGMLGQCLVRNLGWSQGF